MHKSSSWIYGFLQLDFKSDILNDFGFYYAGVDKGITTPKSLHIEGLPARSVSIQELETILEKVDLLGAARVDRFAGDSDPDGECQYVLNSGVCIFLLFRKVVSIWVSLDGPLKLRTMQEWYSEQLAQEINGPISL